MNEGIKPRDKIVNNGHCPVPVFLLFDFVKVLSSEKVFFSSGNLAAKGVNVYSDIKDLERLEFDYIYHREPLPSDKTYSILSSCRGTRS